MPPLPEVSCKSCKKRLRCSEQSSAGSQITRRRRPPRARQRSDVMAALCVLSSPPSASGVQLAALSACLRLAVVSPRILSSRKNGCESSRFCVRKKQWIRIVERRQFFVRPPAKVEEGARGDFNLPSRSHRRVTRPAQVRWILYLLSLSLSNPRLSRRTNACLSAPWLQSGQAVLRVSHEHISASGTVAGHANHEYSVQS